MLELRDIKNLKVDDMETPVDILVEGPFLPKCVVSVPWVLMLCQYGSVSPREVTLRSWYPGVTCCFAEVSSVDR